MTFDDVRPFLDANHSAVVVTFRKSGAAQARVVTCVHYQSGVAFTTTSDRAKLANLRRDPRCTILVSRRDWSAYAVLEGTADIRWSDRTDAEQLRITLREVYRACSGKDHPDWEEYDQAMLDQRRAAIIVRPRHIYGVGT